MQEKLASLVEMEVVAMGLPAAFIILLSLVALLPLQEHRASDKLIMAAMNNCFIIFIF
jgi:hypothetical protein